LVGADGAFVGHLERLFQQRGRAVEVDERLLDVAVERGEQSADRRQFARTPGLVAGDSTAGWLKSPLCAK
jgi:hypothetical protein